MVALGRRVLPTLIGTMLLALALTPAAPSAGASSHGEGFTVNIVDAVDKGCSPDSWTKPDLRVRVFVDGVLLIETEKGQDLARPLFAHAAKHAGTAPVVLGIEVDEAEPGGFFGIGTSWIRCQIGPDGGTRFNATYDGTAERVIVATGAGTRAAETTIVVGTTAPPKPGASANDITSHGARLTWNASTAATAHHLAFAGAGEVFATEDGAATNHQLSGLCDNARYVVRVIREQGAWRIGESVTFTTTNIAPAPARILSADASGDARADVRWEAPQHDIDVFEVHMGTMPSFTPTDASLRATSPPGVFSPHGALGVSTQASDTYVRIVSVDTGGLKSTSTGFAIGAARLQEHGVPGCGLALAGQSETTSPPATPPPDTDVTDPTDGQREPPELGLKDVDARAPPAEDASRLSTEPSTSLGINPLSFVVVAIVIVVGILIAVVFTIVRK